MNTDSTFTKRLKSFLWRGLMWGIAAIIVFAINHVADLGLSATVTAVAGLVLGEISKYVNDYIDSLNASTSTTV